MLEVRLSSSLSCYTLHCSPMYVLEVGLRQRGRTILASSKVDFLSLSGHVEMGGLEGELFLFHCLRKEITSHLTICP